MDELKVNISSDQDTVTILTGKANVPDRVVPLVLNGDFSSVSNYLKVKRQTASAYQFVSPERTIVVCDYDNLTMKLLTDPNDTEAAVITGSASYSKELKEFGINQTKFFNKDQLVKLFRYNRMYFPNKEENAILLSGYQNFSASVKKNITDNSDQRGNHKFAVDKKLNTDIPEGFVIEIPIFKGEKAVSFPVEICMDENDSGVRFWFESVELKEMIHTKTIELFDRELKSCEGFAIIYK